MADGSVTFFSESIDTGDPSRATLTSDELAGDVTPSPYGVWGALGTAAGEESVEAP